LSLAVGVLMLVGKVAAYVLTGSAAILSDAAESVITSWRSPLPHSASTWPCGQPTVAFDTATNASPSSPRVRGRDDHPRRLWIVVAAVEKWLAGLTIERLGPARSSWRPRRCSTRRWAGT